MTQAVKTTRVEWRSTTSKQAQDLLDEAELSNRKKKQLNDLYEAEGFLREILANGPRLANEVIAAARRSGISTRDLTTAKDNLGVTFRRRDPGQSPRDNPMVWVLPEEAKTVDDDVPF
jgi:hypothetical protein